MRKFAVVATAVGVLFGFASVAQAKDIRTMSASLTPNKAGASSALSLKLTTVTNDGTVPNSAFHDDIFLPKGIAINGRFLTGCDRNKLVTNGPSACKGSSIGTGSVAALLHACGSNPPVSSVPAGFHQTIALQLFNGLGGKSLLAYLTNPIIGAQVIPVVIKNASGIYGKKFVLDVPDRLLQPVTGTCAALVDVTLKVAKKTVTETRKVKGKNVKIKHGMIENGPCASSGPTKNKWFFRDDVKFGTGAGSPPSRAIVDTSSGSATQACKR